MESESRAQATRRDLASRDLDASSVSTADLERSNQLFEEATREWHDLAESLLNLKKSLDPADFAAALAHLEIPGLESLIRDWRKAQADYEKVLDSESVRRKSRPAPRKRTTGRSNAKRKTAPGKTKRPTRERASEVGAEPPPPPGTDSDEAQVTPERTTEIQKQLAELTSLLRQHVAVTANQGASSSVEIPKQLTLSIAREVAGRVRDSVLETLRASDSGGERGDRKAGNAADRRAKAKSEKIPLEDVAAMIDQLTKF